MQSIPLFPLSGIVLPGGRLPLRIFEQRYVDMVRECVKQQTGFGICPIDNNTAKAHAYGTLVEIIDWDTDVSGLLIIVTKGIQKFRIISTTRNTNGLLLAQVELLPLVKKTTIPSRYSDLVELLRRALLNVEALLDDNIDTDFTDAVWVSNRLLETLPLAVDLRFELMVIDDPIAQLDALQEFTKNWQPTARFK